MAGDANGQFSSVLPTVKVKRPVCFLNLPIETQKEIISHASLILPSFLFANNKFENKNANCSCFINMVATSAPKVTSSALLSSPSIFIALPAQSCTDASISSSPMKMICTLTHPSMA